MGHSILIELIYRILPFRAWKGWLLRNHMERCPGCRKRLVSREEARLILVQADDVGDLDRLWPSIKDRLGEKAKKSEKSALSKPAMAKMGLLAAPAVAVLLIAAAVNFWLFQKPRPDTPLQGGPSPAETEQVQIHYVKIDDEPAQTFIFQPRDSNIIIIWAGRNL
jgi:hypothetical protein